MKAKVHYIRHYCTKQEYISVKGAVIGFWETLLKMEINTQN